MPKEAQKHGNISQKKRIREGSTSSLWSHLPIKADSIFTYIQRFHNKILARIKNGLKFGT